MTSIQRYSIERVVNWYYENFCTKKCFNKDSRILECYRKFHELVEKNKGLTITHKEFKDLVDNSEIKICKLDTNFRKRTVCWSQFETWLKDQQFDPDKFE